MYRPRTIEWQAKQWANSNWATDQRHLFSETTNDQAISQTIGREQSNNQKSRMSEQIIETNGLIKPNTIERLTKQSTKQIIENNYSAKSKMIANNWLTKYENNYNHLQHQTRSRTGNSSGLGAGRLEPAGGLKPTKKAWWLRGWCRKINSEVIPDSTC